MSEYNSSNNDILFKATLAIISRDPHKFKHDIFNFISDAVHNDWVESPGKNFSHDNIRGILCFAKEYDYYALINAIPLFNRYSLHPGRFAIIAYAKYGWPALPLMPLYTLMVVWSCATRFKRDHLGNRIIKSDGQILFLLESLAMNIPITSFIGRTILRMIWGPNYFYSILNHYHSNQPNDIQLEILRELKFFSR